MKKILIIDDEEILRENMLDLLQLEGYVCKGAESAEQGLEKIIKWQPDLILCDIKMPGREGYWVLDQLKDDISYAKIPFIFVTAKVEAQDIRTGMKMGADDYLTKPFTRSDLLDSIEARFKRIEMLKAGFAGLSDPNLSLPGIRKQQHADLEKLTKSEKEILYMIAEGLSSSEIADKRFNSIKTIENHRANIISKLGLNGHLALVKYSMSIDSNSILNSWK